MAQITLCNYVIGQSPALPTCARSGHAKKVSLANVKSAVEEAASWTAGGSVQLGEWVRATNGCIVA